MPTVDTGHAMAANLIADWYFNEGAGLSVADLLGNHNATFASGAVWSNGGMSCVKGATMVSPRTWSGAAMTVFAKVIVTDIAAETVIIDNMANVSSTQGVQIYHAGSSGFRCRFGNSGGDRFGTSSVATQNVECTIAFVCRGTGSTDWRFFKDGAYVSNYGYGFTFNIAPPADTCIGRWNDSTAGQPGIIIKRLVLWARGLTDQDVADFHANPDIYLIPGSSLSNSPSASPSSSVSSSPSSSVSASPSVGTYNGASWGIQSPGAGVHALSWQACETSDGVKGTVEGDPAWGTLEVESGLPSLSSVVDTFYSGSQLFTVAVGAGTGAVSVQIRGSDTIFTQHAGTPNWVAYEAPFIRSNWRYVQVKLSYVP